MSRSHKRSPASRKEYRQQRGSRGKAALSTHRCSGCSSRIRISNDDHLPCLKCGGRLIRIGNK